MKTTYPMPLDAEVASLKTDLAEQNTNVTNAMQKMFVVKYYRVVLDKTTFVPVTKDGDGFRIYNLKLTNPEGYKCIGDVGISIMGRHNPMSTLTRHLVTDNDDGTSTLTVMLCDQRTNTSLNNDSNNLVWPNFGVFVLFVRSEYFTRLPDYIDPRITEWNL